MTEWEEVKSSLHVDDGQFSLVTAMTTSSEKGLPFITFCSSHVMIKLNWIETSAGN